MIEVIAKETAFDNSGQSLEGQRFMVEIDSVGDARLNPEDSQRTGREWLWSGSYTIVKPEEREQDTKYTVTIAVESVEFLRRVLNAFNDYSINLETLTVKTGE